MIATILASTLGTGLTLLAIPVAVAVLTTAGNLVLKRFDAADGRRRDHYAAAVASLVAWTEFAYRVRRRVDDEPETMAALAAIGHDLQERLACHQAWISTDNTSASAAFKKARADLAQPVGDALKEAWSSPPIKTAVGMNLGNWGPGAAAGPVIEELQRKFAARFGAERFWTWWGGPKVDNPTP
jgi:hypothetical protein